MKTSESLAVGEVYTRNQLKEMFGIKDATINTGTFHPKDHDSVWLFVTEKKTSDRTQYYDCLDDDVLHWDGQTTSIHPPLLLTILVLHVLASMHINQILKLGDLGMSG